MEIIHFLNSDFGIDNTIGARSYYIAKENKDSLIIICRGHNKVLINNFNIIKVFFGSRFIMRLLSSIPIFFSKKFPSNKIKNYLFDYFALKKIKKLDLSNISLIHSWDFLPKTYSYIKKNYPKIVIIQDIPMAFTNILKNLNNYKMLFNLKNTSLPDYIKESLNYINYFIVPSLIVKESLINEGINKNKIFIVPFGVDIKKFKPIKKNYLGTFKAAFSGNVNNRKGIPYLIRAWKELNLKKAELNIYGLVYPEVKKYFKEAKKYNIKIHGFIKNINEELPKNHIYVFPSLLEGSAKSIYEAMASGLPIITTKNSGSIIENKKEGFIIPIQNINKLKEKILYFYKNREKIKEFGIRARKKAEKYTWKEYAKKINKIYEKVIK